MIKNKNLKFSASWFYIFVMLVMMFLLVNETKAQSCPSQTLYTTNSATLVGEITDTGGDANIEAWFRWGQGFNLTNETAHQFVFASTLPFRFCYTITGLQSCTTYSYQAFARNSAGTTQGAVYTFTTRCSGTNPSVDIKANGSDGPVTINYGQSVTLSWTSSNANSCTASGDWSGTKPTSGVQVISGLNVGSYTFGLTCSGSYGTSYDNVNVIVTSLPFSGNTLPSGLYPKAIITYSPQNIRPGTVVTFDASNSYDPDGTIVSYEWKVNGNIESNSKIFNRALASGAHRIELTVTDNQGLKDTDTLIISVGRTSFLTRTVTRVVTREVPVTVTTASAKLANLLLEDVYEVKKCSQNEIQITLVNNTSVRRKINIRVEGEARDWFSPREISFILDPKTTQVVRWKLNVPCNIKDGDYNLVFVLETPGQTNNYSSTLRVKPSEPIPLLGFLGALFYEPNLVWLLILLIILLIIINAFLWHKYIRKKEEKEILEPAK